MASPSTTDAPRRVCASHPDRPGHALCMACKKVVCQECATEWEGIHYCAACLAKRREASRQRSSLGGLLLLVAAAWGLFLLTTRLMVWAGVFAASLR